MEARAQNNNYEPASGIIRAKRADFDSFQAQIPLLQFSGRILIAVLFLLSGALKVAHPGATMEGIASGGLPFPALALIGAIATELGGGVALAVGYQTRLVAAGLAVFSIVTAMIFHNQLGDINQLNHFLKNFAIAGGLLQIIALGAGNWSVDRRIRSKKMSA